MRFINLKWSFLILAGLSVCIWLISIRLQDIAPGFTWDSLKEIPAVGGYLALICVFFSSVAWKWRIFQGWLVQVPNLNGTWKGEIRSEWIDPETGGKSLPITTYLVVRQSLNYISCIQITAESKSRSVSANIIMDKVNQVQTLHFVYSNKPRVSVQHRSNNHDGATSLDIVLGPSRRLMGKYWTDREPTATKGEVEYEFDSLILRREFPGE